MPEKWREILLALLEKHGTILMRLGFQDVILGYGKESGSLGN